MSRGEEQLPLAAAGVMPGEVDFVMCTHLHVDHVGWNTRLDSGRWVPTFPRAKYLFGRQEFEHWTGEFRRGHSRRPGRRLRAPPSGES
jgi:glyoxylase-like metal-dependent hydrolase (beta-lactamase superfamily II)